jgi:hypothetical protein
MQLHSALSSTIACVGALTEVELEPTVIWSAVWTDVRAWPDLGEDHPEGHPKP